MFELAAGAVGAVKLLMESLAKLSLVVLGDVGLRVELLCTVREGAAGFEGAVARQLPVLAQLSLVLGTEAHTVRLVINYVKGVVCVVKVLLFNLVHSVCVRETIRVNLGGS